MGNIGLEASKTANAKWINYIKHFLQKFYNLRKGYNE